MQYCPSCGVENTDTAKFCNGCGVQMNATASSSTPPPGPQPSQAQGTAAAHPTLAQQTVLHNRYFVLKLLGQGGMGAVYLTEDQKVFKRLCVVKEMLPYYATKAERQQAERYFEREARLLANLRNPHVPQVYEYFIENNQYYLVMEWVEGENLEDHLVNRSGVISEPDVLDYALQLANILVYTAKQNPPVIHRDIKPANIIVGDDGQVKLVDFGIAKETMGSGLTGKMSESLGTPGYAPPEQYSGQVEPRSDVYALGATMHHLLSGRDPRNEAPFQFPPIRALTPGVSPELEKLLIDMLQLDAAMRPTPVELRAKLESFVAPTTPGGSQFQPFVFRSGAVAANLHELAQACDRHWDEAVEHLYNGDFEPWLTQFNRPDLAVRASSIKRMGGDRSAGLEEFIRAIDHTMTMPSLVVDQSAIDLGLVEKGERRTITVMLMNAGRGYLHGGIQNSASWVKVSPRGFGLREGQQTPLTIMVDTGALDEGAISQTILEATSNGGRAVVNLNLDVTWQPRLEILPLGTLDFGDIPEGQQHSATTVFTVRNAGGGVLAGQLVAGVPWIQMDHAAFSLVSGGELTITATADPTWIGQSTFQKGIIHVSSTNGVSDKPALVRIQKPWYIGWPRVSTWLVYGLLILTGYLGAVVPLSIGLASFLGWPQPEAAILAVLIGFLVLSPLALMLSRRFVPRLDEIEDYHFRGRLADALTPNQLDMRRLAWSAGIGVLFGALLGWWFGELRVGDVSAEWAILGGTVGVLAGASLAVAGSGIGRASGSNPLGNMTWLSGPTYAITRSIFLMLAGILFGLMAGALVMGGVIRPIDAVVGGLIGLLMGSESHRLLCLRLRWLLQQARQGVWPILVAYVSLSLIVLLRWHQPRSLLGYGYLAFVFGGIGYLLWLLLYSAVTVVGAAAGLRMADGAGVPGDKALRILTGLTGIQLAVGLPVYIIVGVATHSMEAGSLHMWLNVLATVLTTAAVTWALRFRFVQVSAAVTKTRESIDTVFKRVISALPGALRGVWYRLFPSPLAFPSRHKRLNLPKKIQVPGSTAFGRWRVSLASLTLAEISSDMTLPLAISATGVALLLLQLVASLLMGLIVGLGTAMVYALLLAAVIIGAVLIIRYLQNR